MNTNQIRQTSMADLRAAYFAGKLTFDEVERERMRRVYEQNEIRAGESTFWPMGHPQAHQIEDHRKFLLRQHPIGQ